MSLLGLVHFVDQRDNLLFGGDHEGHPVPLVVEFRKHGPDFDLLAVHGGRRDDHDRLAVDAVESLDGVDLVVLQAGELGVAELDVLHRQGGGEYEDGGQDGSDERTSVLEHGCSPGWVGDISPSLS